MLRLRRQTRLLGCACIVAREHPAIVALALLGALCLLFLVIRSTHTQCRIVIEDWWIDGNPQDVLVLQHRTLLGLRGHTHALRFAEAQWEYQGHDGKTWHGLSGTQFDECVSLSVEPAPDYDRE